MDTKKTILKLMQSSQLLSAINDKKNFSKAAELLGVDQSAISHRVKSLEEALGFRLFDRTTRTLQLTEAGTILCATAADVTVAWTMALDKLDRNRRTDQIKLSLPSSLAMKWFLPLLPAAQNQDLDISLEVNEQTVSFQDHEADIGIRFGQGPYPGLYSVHLSPCWLQPVASPAYIEKYAGEEDIVRAKGTALLADSQGESDATRFSWNEYFSATDGPIDNIEISNQFERADLMLQAAIGGLGVGLGRTLLIENDIKAGFLKPIGPPARIRSSYWLACSHSFAETARFLRLHNWLKSEITRTSSTWYSHREGADFNNF